jgi:hypothetical protein
LGLRTTVFAASSAHADVAATKIAATNMHA